MLLIIALYLLNYNLKESFAMAKRRIMGYDGLRSGIAPPWAVNKVDLDDSYMLAKNILVEIENKLGKERGDLVLGKIDYMTSENVDENTKRYVIDVFVHDKSIKQDTPVTRRFMMDFNKNIDGTIKVNYINTSNARKSNLSAAPYGNSLDVLNNDELILKDELMLANNWDENNIGGVNSDSSIEFGVHKGSISNKKEDPTPDLYHNWILPLGTEEQYWNKMDTKCVNVPFAPEPTMSIIDENEYDWLFDKARGNVGNPHGSSNKTGY